MTERRPGLRERVGYWIAGGPREPQAPAEPVTAGQPAESRAAGSVAESIRTTEETHGNRGRIIAAALALALVGGAGLYFFHDDLGRTKDNIGAILDRVSDENRSSKVATPTASAAASDGEKAKTEAQAKADAATKAAKEKADAAANTADVPLERKWVKGQEADAAKLHGRDTYSRKASSWEINPEGGVMLKPNPDGSVTRIDTGTAALETWLLVKENSENTKFGAESFVVPAHIEIDIQGGTFWEFGEANNAAGVRQLGKQYRDKELGANGVAGTQPDIKILNVCPPSSVTSK